MIERILKIGDGDETKISEHRDNIFHELSNARKDVSSLTSYQLLLKDMKILENKESSKIVALPGFPMLVSEYLQKPNIEESIAMFVEKYTCDVVVLIGLTYDKSDNVQRDIGIIKCNDKESTLLYERIKQALIQSSNPNFDFEAYIPDRSDLKQVGEFFKQNNVKLSRKQIVPKVVEILFQGE